MHTVLKIMELVLSVLSTVITNKMFWGLVVLIILLYRKSSRLEYSMLGERYSLVHKVSGALLLGFIAGILSSFLVVILGVTIGDYTPGAQSIAASGITYIWIIAILLTFINPRYICFSYAGGIVALANLIFGFPKINVPGLLALVGMLHLIESFLIWIDGYTHAVPVFFKRKDGRVVGGYMMNRMWPIPMVLLAVSIGIGAASNLDMPSWWPILKLTGNMADLKNLIYAPFLVPVVLGYGDMAITKTPQKRCNESAINLGIYSIVLIILAILSSRIHILSFVAALFAPIAHELLIIYGKKQEAEGEPLFNPAGNGITVLYIKNDSPAQQMKMELGDVILSINNMILHSERQLAEFLETYPSYVWMELRKTDGRVLTVEYKDFQNGVTGLGALVVPQSASYYFDMKDGDSPIKRLFDFIRKKGNKNNMKI